MTYNELILRRRAVERVVFQNLSQEECLAIRCFMNGGPCPEKYKKVFELEKELENARKQY